jgi:hypothetical protein
MFQRLGSMTLRDGGNGGVEAGSEQAQEIIARIAGKPREKAGPITIAPSKGVCMDCGIKTHHSARRCQACALKATKSRMKRYVEGGTNAE